MLKDCRQNSQGRIQISVQCVQSFFFIGKSNKCVSLSVIIFKSRSLGCKCLSCYCPWFLKDRILFVHIKNSKGPQVKDVGHVSVIRVSCKGNLSVTSWRPGVTWWEDEVTWWRRGVIWLTSRLRGRVTSRWGSSDVTTGSRDGWGGAGTTDHRSSYGHQSLCADSSTWHDGSRIKLQL